MASLKPGARYLKNKTTGAVFNYNERIVGFKDLVEMVANDDGELVKVESRPKPPKELNPTETPDKETDSGSGKTTTKSTTPSKPTMTPVDNP